VNAIPKIKHTLFPFRILFLTGFHKCNAAVRTGKSKPGMKGTGASILSMKGELQYGHIQG